MNSGNYKMKLAVICNHTYPDLQEFFVGKSKIKNSYIGKDLFFLTNYFAKKNGSEISRVPSSFSKKPFFDKFLILDILYSPLLALYLIIRGVGVLHFTTSHFSNVPLALLFKLLGRKCIFTIHRFDLESYDTTRRFLLSIYEKLLFKISYKIIILSDHHRVPSSKKVIIPMAGYKQYVQVTKSVADYFMFFGRIDDYKGLEDIYRLASDLPHIKFVVAGNGYHEYIEKLKELKNVDVQNRFIHDHELKNLFLKAKLVLLPYKSISQSAVQILSYSYATPVACYDVGNLKDFIEDGKTGYLVSKNNYQEFKNVVENFVDDELFQLSKNCITYFNANFSDRVLYDQYKAFYKKIVA